MAFETLTVNFKRLATTKPFAPAYIHRDTYINFGHLDDLVDRMATWAAKAGVKQNSFVVQAMADPVTSLILSLALLRVGAVQLFLGSTFNLKDKVYGPIEIEFVLSDNLDADADGRIRRTPKLAELKAFDPTNAPRPALQDQDLAAITLGSGTTGTPRLIPFTFGQIHHRVSREATPFGKPQDSRAIVLYNYMSLAFFTRALTLLCDGVCLVGNPATTSFETSHSATLFQLVDIYGVDEIHCTTYHAQLLAGMLPDGAPPRLPHLKTMTIGASPVSEKLRAAIISRITPQLTIAYATNETGIVTRATPHDLLRRYSCVGRVFSLTETRIVKEDGAPAKPGERGVVAVRGPCVIDGYYGNEEETRKNFVDGWFLTGDIGSLTPDGILHLEGRADDMMIMAGFNIYPSEIERVLESHPAVAEAVAVAVKIETVQDVPVAFVIPRRECTEEELAAFAAERLGNRAPRGVFLTSEFPRNPAGKILRRELAARVSLKLPQNPA